MAAQQRTPRRYYLVALLVLVGLIAAALPVGMVAPRPVAADDTALETPAPAPTETSTDIPEPTATSTPEPSPTPSPTSSPAPTEPAPPEPTATQATEADEPDLPSATATTSAPTVASGDGHVIAATGKLTIKSVNTNDQPVAGACFDVYQDAGNGALGPWIDSPCDHDNFDGTILVTLEAGNYVLRQVVDVAGYGRADDKRATVTAGATRTVTIRHYPLSTVVVTSRNKATNELVENVCYYLTEQVEFYPVQHEACDNSDGTVDGVTHFTSADRAPHILSVSYAPPSYFKPADRQVNVTALDTTYPVAMSLTQSGRIVVSFEDQAGEPLLETCAALFQDAGGGTRGEMVVYACDHVDEEANGQVELVGMPAGTYVLGYFAWPLGYFPDEDLVITIANDQTLEHTFTSTPATVVTALTTDESDDPLPGACYYLYQDAGGGVPGYQVWWYQLCDDVGGGGDGSTTIPVHQPGNYLLVQAATPKGHVPPAPVPFSVSASDVTKSVTVVNRLGGKAVVHVVDEHGDPLAGACFHTVQGINAYYSACDADDGANDGTTSIVGLAAGDYELSNFHMPPLYAWLPAQPFSVALGETKTFNLAAEPYGTIEIHKKTPGGDALPGACFEAQPTTFMGGFVFGACDDNNDGTISIRAPEGDFNLVETVTPAGYVAVEPPLVHVDAGQTTTTTITDPTPSTAIIRAIDVSDALVPGLCWTLTIPEPFTIVDRACDAEDGASDGFTQFSGLRGDDYFLIHRTTVSGYLKADPTSLTLGVMETTEFTVLIPQPAPKITKGPWIISLTQTAAVIYWETDQKATGTVDYGLTANLGRKRPTTQPPPSKTHQVELSPLNPGTTYHMRVVSGNVNGDVASSTVSFRTPAATATARLSVTKTNSDRSVLLPGACFDVYTDAGGGALGRYIDTQCDQYDSAPNNGKVLFPALDPGSYVLVESRSPEGYALSAKRTFTVTAGQTYRTTVTNSRGGALLTIKARTSSGKLLRGVCYNVWKIASGGTGEFVAWGCDDHDGENGYTPIGNLRTGTYWVEAFAVPAGFVLPEGKQLTITSGQRTASLTFTTYAETAGDNVEFQAVDGNGKLLPGACFQLFWGNTARSACDWWDGLNDGRTFFTNVDRGTYTALEYHAPPGYKIGKRTTFTKADNTFKRLRFTQSPGGVRVTVKTLKGSTSSVLPGACYVIFKQVSSGSWPNFGSWCDSYDDASDGITRLDGVPAGTYALVQWNTPGGYAAPADKIIVVGSTGQTVTVRTYAGTTAASDGDLPPEFIDPPVIEP